MSTFTLPSGATLELRGLSAKDYRVLADDKMSQASEVEDFILGNCAKMIESGPYAGDASTFDWDRALTGDGFVALIAIRVATYNDKPYGLDMKCPVRSCKTKFTYDVDLAAMLAGKVQRLSEEAAKTFADGNRFEDKIPHNGTRFVYALPTRGSAKKVQARTNARKANGSKEQRAKINNLIDPLAMRILEIEGVNSKKTEARFDFLEGLSLGAIDATIALMDGNDCGIDATLEIECPACNHEWTTALPFTRAFFMPESSMTKARRAREDEKDETEV